MAEQAQHQRTREVLHRLARADGHLRAVHRMVEQGADCADVLVQLAAVKAALDRVARIVLADHMESCLRRAARENAADTAWDDLKRALDRYIG